MYPIYLIQLWFSESDFPLFEKPENINNTPIINNMIDAFPVTVLVKYKIKIIAAAINLKYLFEMNIN